MVVERRYNVWIQDEWSRKECVPTVWGLGLIVCTFVSWHKNSCSLSEPLPLSLQVLRCDTAGTFPQRVNTSLHEGGLIRIKRKYIKHNKYIWVSLSDGQEVKLSVRVWWWTLESFMSVCFQACVLLWRAWSTCWCDSAALAQQNTLPTMQQGSILSFLTGLGEATVFSYGEGTQTHAHKATRLK